MHYSVQHQQYKSKTDVSILQYTAAYTQVMQLHASDLHADQWSNHHTSFGSSGICWQISGHI